MIDQVFEFMTNDLINPGQKLQQLLKELYPLDFAVNKNTPLSFIEAIDYDMIAEQKFMTLIHEM